ncbi:lysM and putative peptidoglycan-binding domain-containing protein 1 isoform X2 [Hirundo rustica]|uniref:lysM and putative peptidoglycan-binding domain-containing protein 1 isoform X2 n=1 Tax=Hirundo rustica TaxID=43150 RepID=UPI0026716DE5|nr:lysM and putative peptidoglycan-binding domain-containing protein 1 isoform X2 [Hirundo rustica]
MAGSGGAGTAPREHRLQPGDTLAGLALRYGVTMEQIQRANRLYSSDTIFLKATLLIPAAPGPFPRHRDPPGDLPGDLPGDVPGPSRHDLSASDFLRRLDAEIGRSKEAAAQRLQSQDTSGDTRDSGDTRNGTLGIPRIRPSPCDTGDIRDTGMGHQ